MKNATNKSAKENNSHSEDTLETKANIFGVLFLLANRLQALGDALDDEITLKQWLFIATIIKSDQQSLTISDLAQYIGTSRQNAKKMAAILDRKGFVAFEKDTADARVLRVSLTDKCFEHFSKRRGLENEFIMRLFNGLEKEIINKTSIGLTALLNNISEMENEIK